MRDAAPIGLGHLVGADVETPVDRRRIAVDDLAVEGGGKGKAERALPGCRRPENRNDDRLIHGYEAERRRRRSRPESEDPAAANGSLLRRSLVVEKSNREERPV